MVPALGRRIVPVTVCRYWYLVPYVVGVEKNLYLVGHLVLSGSIGRTSQSS